MIYESAFVVKNGIPEENLAKVKSIYADAIAAAGGETLVNDDWGLRTFAQPTEKGETKGQYLYLIFRAPGTVVNEIERRLKISESVLKWLVVKLGDDTEQDKIVKGYKNPNHDNVTDKKEALKLEKEKKILSKRKSCYFTLNKTEPDWKNPKTYNWFVNEFGKISPGRITGLRPRYQRRVTKAIKRGRVMGMISYLSNQVSERVQ